MDNKRLILAIALSCLLFLGWNYLASKMGWVPDPATHAPNGNATAPAVQPAQSAPAAVAGDPSATAGAASAPMAVFAPTGGRLVTVDTPLYKAVLHSNGGILREFDLKRYQQSLADKSSHVNLVSRAASGSAPLGLVVDGDASWTEGGWVLEGGDLSLAPGQKGALRFSADIKGLHVVRELTFSADTYTIDEKVRVESQKPATFNLGFTFDAAPLASEMTVSMFARIKHALFGGPVPVAEESQYNPTRVAWFQGNSFAEESSPSTLTAGKLVDSKVSWMAVMNNYFMGAVSLPGENAIAKATQSPPASPDGKETHVYRVLVGRTNVEVSPGKPAEQLCTYYLGPKEAELLNAAPNHMGKALDYGFFSVVARPLIWLLKFFYGFVHNYGVAIILMTVVIKIVFWPLSQKSYQSMNQMKKLQPLMAQIREKHAGDKETMNKEIMQLYKTYKVNPAGGCLPILVQIPVFFGLYQALLNAIELRHAPFIAYLPFTDKIWLADLAARDPYCISPLIMGATMFLQQKMTPAPGDPTQAKVMMFMPVIFTVLFINFPSGLVVYWLVNNVISITQQWLQLRRSS